MVVPQYCPVDLLRDGDVPDGALALVGGIVYRALQIPYIVAQSLFITTTTTLITPRTVGQEKLKGAMKSVSLRTQKGGSLPSLRFLVENQAIPEVKQVSDDGICSDMSTIQFDTMPVSPNTSWVLELLHDCQDVYSHGVDSHASGYTPISYLICRAGGDHRLETRSVGLPSSDAVLRFVKRCITSPFPPHKPALPQTLYIRGFGPHDYPAVCDFLTQLPPPFHFRFQFHLYSHDSTISGSTDELSDSASTASLLDLAERLKDEASAAFERADRPAAVAAYTGAIRCAQDAMELADDDGDDDGDVRRILAILYANRGTVFLAPGKGQDLVHARDDGELVEAVDPGYAKGYHLQARALQLMGDAAAARRTVERGLRYPGVSIADPMLQDALTALQYEERRLVTGVSSSAGSSSH
ncbi:hypothetical protein EVG20_g10111 [Dentipellis fragilis]|uniref:Uncharacterized protein n=1 Tax=Dentipellis fragilis TaxID=205917 RepID=A0A4Y9XVQ8_9AGAM|nr:hypothetical protein EVG20_g10111 [Dentipellis fragilis]